ncbi:ThuA domain-containing protein [Luteolibacter flavescens]|uniref:ThuA domain-containing protein n=1 Tax=Luteolibacter flavescens TaxID=1859460 RepID=A0ABT3FMJ4_9BACT|nr:PVC-type heme-binding CxxCH protein [Luteolibacter flavescens]MCW1884419.1 ThuA domain-containing protein [Luteolibacter flavescens]
MRATLAAILTAGWMTIGQAAPPPMFLQDAVVDGVSAQNGFPTAADLSKAKVILLSAGEKWTDDQRRLIEAFVEKGGGVVLLHDAIPASGWVKGEVTHWSGTIPLFFTPPGREHPLTKGISNFDIEDEMIHGLDVPAGDHVMTTTWSPNRKNMKGTVPQPYVYGVSPVVWTEAKGKGRVVYVVPGKTEATRSHPAIRTLLRRSLLWAAGEDQVDELSSKEDLAALVYPPGGPLSPQKAIESLEVHPDFTAELVASEALISKPLNLDWDDKGRLWVVESVEYPEGKRGGGPESMHTLWQRETDLKKPAPVERKGRDTVSWLEDKDGDGVMDTKNVFADDLDLATSFCFYKDGVIVAQPPHILFLRDTDKDGKADKRETLYTGLGNFDTHAVLNNLRWGLDGWVYATQGYSSSNKVTSGDGKIDFGALGSGIVRFKPDGSKIEMVSAKSGNCWGVDLTADGEMFFTQPTSGDLVMHVPVTDRLMAEAGMGNEPSWQVMVHLRPVKPLMSWEEIVENQPNDVIGSYTAACGCAVYEGGAWPESWDLGYFTCEPTVHIVHHEALSPDGVTYKAEMVRDKEFSATRDFWSRQIDTRVGPDGQLYVIDFYNQAILHNDPRGPIHLWNHQAARPDRDHFFGRIQRYSHKQSKALPKADLTTPDGRIAALSHPNREVRFRAQRLIEEGDVKTAALKLKDAKGVAKIHSMWVRAAAGVLEEDEVIAALGDPDMGVRVTAGRVIGAHPKLATKKVVDAIGTRLGAEKESRVRLQWLAGLPTEAKLSPEVLAAVPTDDRWTLAAVARLSKHDPAAVLAKALARPDAAKHAGLVRLLFDAGRKDANQLAGMLSALESSEEMAVACLNSLYQGELPRNARLDGALGELATKGTPKVRAAALPLAAKGWKEEQLNAAVAELLKTAGTDEQVLVSLAALPVYSQDLAKALGAGAAKSGAVRDAIAASASQDGAKLLIAALPSLGAQDKAKVLEALLGKPASAIALIDALDSGELTLAVVGTTVLPRLADHPDAKVKEHAAPLMKKLRGASEAKDAIIARLLPEVSKPGNAEMGKALFASCAACHKYRDEGALVGPVLEGMGVHGIETLLTHIVDPNREVEPSYHMWNITTTDGKTLAGFVSRETAGSIFVKNAAGETEVPRNTIASRSNTGKSLMPEGYEGLGAEPLRDLITYLRSGEQRFHTVSFGKAATADGSRGVYLAQDTPSDRVGLKRYGLIEERGVPFQLSDPLTTAGGKNVIVLKGGMEDRAVSRTMPEKIEIPVNAAAGRIHVLGGVAGWGFPVMQEKEPLVTIGVHYAGGGVEEIALRNGVEFADHAGRIDVPGSAWADLVSHGQIRYLWRDLKKKDGVIEKLVLTSGNKIAAPMIAAITLESASSDGKLAAQPVDGGPAEQSNASLPATKEKLRVLLAGGGGSHDFPRWYDQEDQEILREAGCATLYTTDPAKAAEELARTDVFLFSSNDPAYVKSAEFQRAFASFIADGGGLVLLHPATWYNFGEWPAFNSTFVGGGARAHDPLGEFGLTVTKADHPVVAGLQREFRLKDELYQVNLDPAAKVQVLIETSVSGQTGKKHPSVWIVEHPKSRIVCIAPGHDGEAHEEPNFRKLIANSVKWAAGK